MICKAKERGYHKTITHELESFPYPEIELKTQDGKIG